MNCLRNLASVEQTAVDESGQIIIIRKYQSLCRRLGHFIPIAQPTPEYLIHLSHLKPEVMGALEKIHHPELRRLLAHQALAPKAESSVYNYRKNDIMGGQFILVLCSRKAITNEKRL